MLPRIAIGIPSAIRLRNSRQYRLLVDAGDFESVRLGCT